MASINEWFTQFFKTSDNGTAHDEYPRFFTPDARLIMGDKVANGTAGTSQDPLKTGYGSCIKILTVRKGMWEKVASRKHDFDIFESEKMPGVYLLQGTVAYGLKSGGDSTVDWVAKAVFKGEGKERALSFYHVFLSPVSTK